MGSNDRSMAVCIPPAGLEGTLEIPADPRGVVLFAHGSGSSRFSPRNGYVAAALREAGFATLLFDLLTAGEAEDRRNVFDIPLLARRLLDATGWLAERRDSARLRPAYFGASTGAAAALVAAAQAGASVAAVVSRGGRPDLAGAALARVTAPTLLIVGGDDTSVIEVNEDAFALMRCEKELRIVPGASHLFEEPGTLQQVIALARDWFERHLPARGERRAPG